MMNKKALLIVFFLLLLSKAYSQGVRKNINLNENWLSIADEKNINAYNGFQLSAYKPKDWQKVNVPHNWDQYEGYQRKLHGNKHGFAWYRKSFKTNEKPTGKRFFLYFEGIGSYATIWLNGKKVGYHAGGRTTFTLDVTSTIKLNNQDNVLAVRADHPANIQDLPWVDGGCSTERGFSEGSQPMGVFRPVHLVITNEVRIEPFGVHIWNDDKVSEKSATLNTESTIKNYSATAKEITVLNQLTDADKNIVDVQKSKLVLAAGKEININRKQKSLLTQNFGR